MEITTTVEVAATEMPEIVALSSEEATAPASASATTEIAIGVEDAATEDVKEHVVAAVTLNVGVKYSIVMR
ncbi:uncharacterized protein A4U43_C07F7170 [Asparagus officinalis]|uniref:Uncharacterized protein n=1 Tax=Asparagus officinalis TaxID=4686 RepID=A0A5P1E9Z4_ASPOF|nr:uncharacterized protein A4U43_C07F7170 [Asparagus officinalis]